MCSYCVHGEKSLQQIKRIEELHGHNNEEAAEIQEIINKVIKCISPLKFPYKLKF